MIDAQFAAELRPSLCTAIASLIEDEHDEIISTRPAEAHRPLAQERSAIAAAKVMAIAARAGGRIRMRDTLRPLAPSGFSGTALSGARKVSARMAWGS